MCQECQQLNTGEQWCQVCNAQRSQKNFAKWTSNNPKIDEFIQECQLKATDANKFLEWIPYEQFANIEYLAEGGFGKVYKAQWVTGNVRHWNQKNNQWQREKDKEFKNQLREVGEFNQTLPNETILSNYQIHQGAVYHSKLLPTKEITQLTQSLEFQAKTLELNKHLTKVKQLAQEIGDEEKKKEMQQKKYRDLKKALKLAFEKSEELEKMITANQLHLSEEIKEVFIKIKELKAKSNIYRQLEEEKAKKEQELVGLKKIIITSIHLDEDAQLDLDTLLENQEKVVRSDDKRSVRQLENSKRDLKDYGMTEEQISQLCQLQIEITNLTLEIGRKTRQLTTQIINNINNVQVGDVIIKDSKISGTIAIGVGQIDNVDFNAINLSNDNWTNLHPFFNQSLIEQWTNHQFTYEQTQEWANVFGQAFNPQEVAFYVWLRDTKRLTPEQTLNQANLEQLRSEYQQTQLIAQIQIPPKS